MSQNPSLPYSSPHTHDLRHDRTYKTQYHKASQFIPQPTLQSSFITSSPYPSTREVISPPPPNGGFHNNPIEARQVPSRWTEMGFTAIDGWFRWIWSCLVPVKQGNSREPSGKNKANPEYLAALELAVLPQAYSNNNLAILEPQCEPANLPLWKSIRRGFSTFQHESKYRLRCLPSAIDNSCGIYFSHLSPIHTPIVWSFLTHPLKSCDSIKLPPSWEISNHSPECIVIITTQSHLIKYATTLI